MSKVSAEAQRKIDDLIHRFKYTADGKVDSWRIMKPDSMGNYRGDCDDFAITTWWFICGESYWKFWIGILFFRVKLWRVLTTPDNVGHLVLEYDGKFIDNIYRKWLPKEEMTHHFRGYLVNNAFMAAIKMLLGKIVK